MNSLGAAVVVSLLPMAATAQDVSVGTPRVSHNGIDPAQLESVLEVDIVNLVFEGLTKAIESSDGLITCPNMAERLSSDDGGITWEVMLRRDLTFSNGEEVTSDIVEKSFIRASAQGGTPYFDSIVQSIELVDPLVLRFRLEEPFGDFPLLLAAPTSFVALESRGNLFGTGPFQVEEFEPGVKVRVARRDEYTPNPNQDPTHSPPPECQTNVDPIPINEVVFLEIPDHGIRLSSLETGEIDVARFTAEEFESDPSRLAGLPFSPKSGLFSMSTEEGVSAIANTQLSVAASQAALAFAVSAAEPEPDPDPEPEPEELEVCLQKCEDIPCNRVQVNSCVHQEKCTLECTAK